MARASFSMSVRGDIRGAIRSLDKIERKSVPRVTVRALNRTATSTRAHAASRGGPIQQNRNIKVGAIKKRILIFKANRRKQVAILVGLGKGVPLIAYSARRTRKGVTVQVKGGRRRLVKGAFIATMSSGHKGVFRRRDNAPRLPIDELWSTTVADAMDNDSVFRQMKTHATKRFVVEFNRELSRVLSRR